MDAAEAHDGCSTGSLRSQVDVAPGLCLRRTKYRASFDSGWQELPEHRIGYVVEGTIQSWSPGGKELHGRGTGRVWPGDTLHRIMATDAEVPTVVFEISMAQEWIERHTGPEEVVLRDQGIGRDRAGTLMAQLYRAFRSPNALFRVNASGTVLCLVAELQRVGARTREPDTASVEQIVGIARSSFRAPPSLEEVSDRVHLSVSEVCRKVKDRTGMTFGEHVRAARAQQARKLIRTSRGVPLREIAAKCGYTDQSHLTHQFRQHFGVTPGAYRDKVRRGGDAG